MGSDSKVHRKAAIYFIQCQSISLKTAETGLICTTYTQQHPDDGL